MEICYFKSSKLLHIDDKVGSIKVGKDADIVHGVPIHVNLCSSRKTIIEGTVYYDAMKLKE
jgi:imidazolonepropionase-like amidohydrolase